MNTLKFGNGEWYGKKDTILAYNDLNSNFKPLSFNFDRASSATRVNKDGLIETVGNGEPRIDYKDDSKGALKLEPSRSNLITYSEDFSQWSQNQTTIVLNDIISPDGTLNAAKLTSTNAYSSIFKSGISAVSGSVYTLSCFFKNATSNEITLRLVSSNDSRYIFNLSDLSIRSDGAFNSGFVSAKIDVFPNDWFRCSLTFTAASTTIGVNIYPKEQDLSELNSVNLYGAQLEQGSYATSYIPTQGGVVTRVQEVVNNTNSLMSGLTDMAMFVDYQLPNGNSSSFRNQLGFRDNANANFYMIQFPSSNTHEFRYTGVSGVNVDMTPSISEQDFGLRRKLLYTKKGTTLKVFCNGVEVSTVTNASATTFSTTTEILNAGNNYDIDMDIKEWKLYNNGFTDQEAIALTTL